MSSTPQDIEDLLIYSKRITMYINDLAKEATRLEIKKDSSGCSKAWNDWHLINDELTLLSTRPGIEKHYDKLANIYDTLMNGCGPSLTESR